ncbi:MAG: hypothetical protein JO291_10510 [Acidimicrobiia bacterium]|nr:hypothetical protein [Acidimicrobiia bacterium]
MDTDTMATLYAGGRIALGTVLTLLPGATRPWLGPVAGDPDAKTAIRIAGVRDGLLGTAVLGTRDAPDIRRTMVLLCAIADTADALMTAADLVRTRRPGAAMTTAAAAGGAVAGYVIARRLQPANG